MRVTNLHSPLGLQLQDALLNIAQGNSYLIFTLYICLRKENNQRNGYEKLWHVSSDVSAIPSDKLSK
jgi:hypothetical protein